MSFLNKLFGEINPNEFTSDINQLKYYFDIVYENKEELGVQLIRIAPNVFMYNSSAGSLNGSLGLGANLAVAGIGGDNDMLAQQLGGEVDFLGKHNYYQFRVRKKFSKREMIVILEELCSILKSKYINLEFEFNKKTPSVYVR